MTDGWDLYAVVRGCTPGTAPTPFVDQHHDVEAEDPFPNFSSSAPLTFQNDDDTTPFSYPDDGNDTANNPQIEGLEEIYKQMHVQPQLFSDIPDFQGFENQQQIHQPELNNSLAPPSSFLSTLPITNSQSNPVRARRRKNQQMKMVHQMTQEQLSGDSWAWRKYGQKPIKGSPYPRNYYRCSTSKGCAARRQVEISPIDSSVFIVSYTGEHIHPRPTHRSSLAGSTRNKLSAAAAAVNYQKSMSGDSSSSVPNFFESKPPSCTSTSPASASSFSPPLMEGENHEAAHDNNIQLVDDIDDDDDDDQEVLIPNTVMNEEIFKGFQELSEGSGFF